MPKRNLNDISPEVMNEINELFNKVVDDLPAIRDKIEKQKIKNMINLKKDKERLKIRYKTDPEFRKRSKQRTLRYQKEHPEKIKVIYRRYQIKNRDKINKYQRERYHKLKGGN